MPTVTRAPKPAPPSPSAVVRPDDDLSDPLRDPLEAPAASKADGLANYTATLGQTLGPALYGVVAEHLSLSAVRGYADAGLQAAMKAAGEQNKDPSGPVDDQAVDAMVSLMQDEYAGSAGDFLAGDGKKLHGKLVGVVDTHPKTVVAVALLAAAAAVLADMEVPELRQRFDLGGGWSAGVAAKLGTLQRLALDRVEASLAWQGELVRGSVTVADDADKGLSASASASVGSDKAKLSTDVTVAEDGVVAHGVRGLATAGAHTMEAGAARKEGTTTLDAAVTTKDGDQTAVRSATYDASTGKLSLKDKRIVEAGAGRFEAERGSASDGSTHAAVGAARDLGASTRVEGGFKRTTGADGATSDAVRGAVRTRIGGVDASASADHTVGGGTKLALGGKFDNGDVKAQGKLSEDTATGHRRLALMGQKNLGEKWKARVEADVERGEKGRKREAGALLYRKLLTGTGVFGGGSVRNDDKGTRFVPKVGVQVKGVPFELEYDRAKGQAKVGLTLPF